jgi:hypothetical protein
MGVDMSNNKSTYILGGIIFLALMAMVSWPIGATATSDNEPKNGWGEATSEETAEEKEGKEFGAHASDPNEDGPGNDERVGIGNVGDTEDNNLHPSDLGDFLDSVDSDDCDDTNPPPECD